MRSLVSKSIPYKLRRGENIAPSHLYVHIYIYQRLLHIQKSNCSVVQLCQLFGTPWTASHQASLSIANSWSLLKLMSIELVMPSNHLILCHPFLLLPSVFPSIRVFSNELALCIRWPEYWIFSFSISPSNEYSGLFSSRMDWFDLLVLSKGLFKNLLQHHSSFESINTKEYVYRKHRNSGSGGRVFIWLTGQMWSWWFNQWITLFECNQVDSNLAAFLV